MKNILIVLAAMGLAAAGGTYWYLARPSRFAPAPILPSLPPGATSTTSGIRGAVMLGPTCPVERIPPDPRCAPRPYQTLVAIFRASDPVHAVAFVASDASGSFSVALPPGDYTLGAGESNLPRCDHPQVTVRQDSFASIVISCDTGIR